MSDPTERAQALAKQLLAHGQYLRKYLDYKDVTIAEVESAASLLACADASCGVCVCCLTYKADLHDRYCATEYHRERKRAEQAEAEVVSLRKVIESLNREGNGLVNTLFQVDGELSTLKASLQALVDKWALPQSSSIRQVNAAIHQCGSDIAALLSSHGAHEAQPLTDPPNEA